MLDMFIVVLGYTLIISGTAYFVSWIWIKGINLILDSIDHFTKWYKNTRN